jgi:hypothetical protein
MKMKIIALLAFIIVCLGCANYQYRPETGSCFPYAQYRGYQGPYCSPSP